MNDSACRVQEDDEAVKVPIDFVPPSWEPYACPAEGEIDRQMWEICLLNQVRQALKGGNLHVPHSRAFQSLEQYLIGREEWDHERETLTEEHQLPLDFQEHWPKVSNMLKEQLRLLNDSFPANSALKIEADQFHLTRPEKHAMPASARELKERVKKMLKPRQLSDLLLETEAWTGFLKSFTRLTSGRPITEADAGDQVALLACLIAEGCAEWFSFSFRSRSKLIPRKSAARLTIESRNLMCDYS